MPAIRTADDPGPPMVPLAIGSSERPGSPGRQGGGGAPADRGEDAAWAILDRALPWFKVEREG